MALKDVTAEGVERAIVEFDRLGRKAFLTQYGFGEARDYFVIRDGRRYDSKAVVGVAHGYDRPDLGYLQAKDFSGGDATVVRQLESLGFDIAKPIRSLTWAEEELILALDLYLRSGLLDDKHPSVVDLSRVLNALPIHSASPDSARFRNPNDVAIMLANFAAIDPNYGGQDMTRGGNRDAEVWNRYALDEDTLAEVAEAIRKGRGLPTVGPNEHVFRHVVEVEAQHVEQFQFSIPSQDIEATRREHKLVLDYVAHLTRIGHGVSRHRYPLHGAGPVLVCDLVDETDQVLYEAKGDVRRTSVRLAVGQLLDYRRFEPNLMKLAILLPRQPAHDLIKLIHSVPASAVWRTKDGFASIHP